MECTLSPKSRHWWLTIITSVAVRISRVSQIVDTHFHRIEIFGLTFTKIATGDTFSHYSHSVIQFVSLSLKHLCFYLSLFMCFLWRKQLRNEHFALDYVCAYFRMNLLATLQKWGIGRVEVEHPNMPHSRFERRHTNVWIFQHHIII